MHSFMCPVDFTGNQLVPRHIANLDPHGNRPNSGQTLAAYPGFQSRMSEQEP
jgi:hypothetical protein